MSEIKIDVEDVIDDRMKYDFEAKAQSFVVSTHDMFPAEFIFSIGQGKKQIEKLLRKHNEPQKWIDIALKELDNENMGGYTLKMFGNIFIYLPKYNDWNTKDRGTVAHEIFHAVDMLAEKMGQSLVKDAEEFYAYMIGYLTMEFYAKVSWK